MKLIYFTLQSFLSMSLCWQLILSAYLSYWPKSATAENFYDSVERQNSSQNNGVLQEAYDPSEDIDKVEELDEFNAHTHQEGDEEGRTRSCRLQC